MADANVMDNLPLEMSPGISPMAMDEDEVDEGCAQPRFLCCKTQKNLIAFLAGALLLLAGVGGLVLVLSDHPAFREVKDLVNNNSNSKNTKESPENEAAVLALRQRNDAYFRQLRDALVSEVYNDSYNPYIFLQPNSAQKRAMEWMSYKDTLHLPLPIFQNNTATATNIGNTNASDHDISEEAKTEVMHRWIQRFALTTFYYENAGFMWGLSFSDNATSAETNVTKSTWSSQTGVHECDWEFLECDDNDRVIGLYLGGTSVTLSGTLPDEIGLLSELRHLILSQNRLKGSLPSKFYDLTNLGRSFMIFDRCLICLCWTF